MINYMVYRPGYGNADLYIRRRRRVGAAQEYWNWATSAWDTSESTNTKVFLAEVADSDFSSIYALTVALTETTGVYVEEVFQTSTGDVIQQNLPTTGTTAIVEYTGTTLQSLLDMALQRAAASKLTAKMPFMDASNLAMDIIYKRLLAKKSDLIKAAFTRSVIANTASYYVPDDFFGFFERPYFSSFTTLLDPLPVELRAQLTTSGTPRYYELRGNTLTLFPTPSTTFTFNGNYFQKRTVFTQLTDAVPFFGLIDFLLLDAIMRISEQGMAVVADPVFRQSLYSQLEEALPLRAPRQVRFLQTIEGGQRVGRGLYRDYWGDV